MTEEMPPASRPSGHPCNPRMKRGTVLSRAHAVARLACLAVFWALAAPAAAEEDGVGMELNKLEDIDGGCRVYLVLGNATGVGFSAFKIDLVLFDRTGVINKRLAVDVAPLRPGKTTVRLFDIEGVPCAEAGRILVNDVIECRGGETERQNCVDLVATGSRARTELIK